MKKPNLPLIVATDYEDKYCVLDGLKNVEDEYEISKGISRAKGFPTDAYFRMSNQHKKLVALSDALYNLESQLVVSRRLKEFIEVRHPRRVEFLKVTILNHKGKPVPEEYHIMNPLVIVDCIDKAKSKLNWNVIDPEMISTVMKLVPKPESIKAELLLFRPKHFEHRVMVQHAFGEEMQAAGFTGLVFTEASQYLGA